MERFSFEAIGTQWKIDIKQPRIPSGLFEKIQARIAEFDKAYSRFRPDSLVTEMSQKAGVYELPPDADPMLALYERAYRLTDGAVTPLIGQVLSDAGYDANYSLVTREMHVPPSWDAVMEWKPPMLTLKRPELLDFGAAGKGYLIDIVADVMHAAGVESFSIDAGGDILQRSAERRELRVGLEHPANFEQVIGVATITNQSICGSAGNRRVWGKFHHIINPHTLSSPRDLLAVWAVAETTLLADMLTTCLFFVPPAKVVSLGSFEYLLVRPDFSLEASAHFPAELFT
jgi:thiamine biosynthesis lipoprotein